MPSKNSVKEYVTTGYYHIYNRGVEKRLIFQDQQDYGVFLSYLKTYLLPANKDLLMEQLGNQSTSPYEKDRIRKLLRLNNFATDIILVAYCLMPNHFHILIKQNNQSAIDPFMNSLGTRYTMYFNSKYKRVGPLYQDVYKAVLVKTDEQLLHLSRYIHKQALILQGDALQNQPSSYPEYCGLRNTTWIHPEEILNFFPKTQHKSYIQFMALEEIPQITSNLIIEDD
ncbi:MAG: transposase [Candidatus Blackburnbacteria bacterium]|nr:transposase [Candidatus Blackburnbacteria bacterium]